MSSLNTTRRCAAACAVACLALGITTAPVQARGPSVAEIAANMHKTVGQVVTASGLTEAQLQARLDGSSAPSAAVPAATATLSPYDAGGGAACYGYGHRGSWLDSTGATIGAARHDVYCPPIVISSYCEVEIRFPGQTLSSARKASDNNCDVITSEKINNYGNGVMHGEWAAISTANWLAHSGCVASNSFVYCQFNTNFAIPGYGSPWDDFAWAPSF